MGAERSVREQHAVEMRRVVGGFEQSGLTQAAYCRARGILLTQFHYWREMPVTSRQPSFVELAVVRDVERRARSSCDCQGVTAVVGADNEGVREHG